MILCGGWSYVTWNIVVLGARTLKLLGHVALLGSAVNRGGEESPPAFALSEIPSRISGGHRSHPVISFPQPNPCSTHHIVSLRLLHTIRMEKILNIL